MKFSRHVRYSFYGLALLSLLLLTACGGQAASTVTPTPTPPPTPTPTSAPLPTPTPTAISGTPLGGNLIINGNAEQGQSPPTPAP